MLLFPLRSAQGFYFPVLSRIENCQYPFFPPSSSQDLSMCNHCWLDSPFSGTQLCCLNAHPSLPANFKCFTGSCFCSNHSELHITSNVPLQNNNNKKKIRKKNQTKNPHQKIPQNLNPPYPPIPRCFKSLGYPTVEWCVCRGKRCIWTEIKFGPSWEFQALGCTFSPGIFPPFWQGRTIFFTLHLWKLKMP